jgi:hypothetical protein
VGGDQEGRAFGMALLAHQVQHLVGGVRCPGWRWVRRRSPGRVLDQRPGDGHALALAARQGIRPVRRMLVQAHGAQHVCHALAALGRRARRR